MIPIVHVSYGHDDYVDARFLGKNCEVTFKTSFKYSSVSITIKYVLESDKISFYLSTGATSWTGDVTTFSPEVAIDVVIIPAMK